MLTSLDTRAFFTDAEVTQLRALGLWQDSHTTPAKLALAGLMLAPIMQIVMRDNATTSAEFESVRIYIGRIERELELATKSDMEEIGTDMGLLPMLPSSWDNDKFTSARPLLAAALERLSDIDAHAVRNEIARAGLAAARAGSTHMISLHMVDGEERSMLREFIREFKLEKSSEGLNLIDQTGG